DREPAPADSATRADSIATANAEPHAPPATAADSCGCRIEGTIEVQSNQPLPQRVPVGIWLADQPTERDSIVMALGSPRGFVLNANRCGPHHIRYRTYSGIRFHRLSAEPMVNCAGRH